MMYKQTTQVPNIIFDTYLPTLTGSEYKMLSIIIRQTYGWYDKATGQRKTRDRISHGQFMKKTGLSRRVISKTLKSLVDKNLIHVTCQNGNLLHVAEERKGMAKMFYSFQTAPIRSPGAKRTKGVKQIGEILSRSQYLPFH